VKDETAINQAKEKLYQDIVKTLKAYMEVNGFTHFNIGGVKHKYPQPKGVLMHYKAGWKGGQLLALVKWAYANPEKASQVQLHFKTWGSTILNLLISMLEKEVILKGGLKVDNKPKPKKKAPQGKSTSGKKP
jgi:hypothetical protein